jgi:hypothetical protein
MKIYKPVFNIVFIIIFIVLTYIKLDASSDYTIGPKVSPSAKGWNLMEGDNDTTIVINPEGKKINIGKTDFSDVISKVTLWVINVKELNAKFLVIYFSPIASGAVPMTLCHIDKNNDVSVSAVINHHWELRADLDNADDLKDMLFTDSDRDNILELQDDDVGKYGGKFTFYSWLSKEKKFIPLWVETLELEEGDSRPRLISRINVQKETVISSRKGSQTNITYKNNGIDLQQLLLNAKGIKKVIIPHGTYILPKSLIIPYDNMIIYCEPGTRILVDNSYDNVINIHGRKNIQIENAHLSHLRPRKYYACHGHVVDIENSENIKLYNCEINGCGAIGVGALKTDNLTIQNCWIHSNSFNAVALSTCNEVLLVANIIENNANFLSMSNVNDFEASDNLIRNNGGYWRKRDRNPGMKTK